MSNLKRSIDRGITEFYLSVDIDIIKQSLEDEDYNIDELDKKISQFSKRVKFNYKAIAAKESIAKRLDIISKKFMDAIEKNIEKPIATLNALIEEKELSVRFRNLDKLTEEEIKEIIRGKNLVDLMDELDEATD